MDKLKELFLRFAIESFAVVLFFIIISIFSKLLDLLSKEPPVERTGRSQADIHGEGPPPSLSVHDRLDLDLTEPCSAQVALDRFWASQKTNVEIGKLYEQYIGYLYELMGYRVTYFGIERGRADHGVDLIAKREETLLIQCKKWSRSKVIHIKYIHQLLGGVADYASRHPKEMVHGAFFTTTHLAEDARDAARRLGIEVHERHPLKPFPIIKCKLMGEGGGLYYLPSDLMYDNIRMELDRGDRYCMTVAEAEDAGFRRAFRWHGTSA